MDPLPQNPAVGTQVVITHYLGGGMTRQFGVVQRATAATVWIALIKKQVSPNIGTDLSTMEDVNPAWDQPSGETVTYRWRPTQQSYGKHSANLSDYLVQNYRGGSLLDVAYH